MSKKISGSSLTLPPNDRGFPKTAWLYEAIKNAILEGQLLPGMRLPSTRDLANTYSLARGTVVQAYDALIAEGFLFTQVGAGTRVSSQLEGLNQKSIPFRPKAPSSTPLPQSKMAKSFQELSNLNPGGIRPFLANLPALDLFPVDEWAKVANKRTKRMSLSLMTACEPMGYLPLRQAIRSHLATTRGVQCHPEQIAIVSGAQHALEVATQIAIDPGDTVIVEDPGYDGARKLFLSKGLRVAPCPVDGEGLILDSEAFERARMVYVTPSHQFPLGYVMSIARRLQLLELARIRGMVVIEDDYDSEYRFSGKPIPSLQGLDTGGNVMLVGSFSKTLFPALRLGYVVVPTSLVESFSKWLALTQRHASTLPQAILSDFMDSGQYGRHIRRMREVYAERLGVLLDCGKRELQGLLDISPIEAGLQTVGWLAEGFTGVNVEELLFNKGIEAQSLCRYGTVPGNRAGLQLGFAAIPPDEIERGIHRMAAVLGHGLSKAPAGNHGHSAAFGQDILP